MKRSWVLFFILFFSLSVRAQFKWYDDLPIDQKQLDVTLSFAPEKGVVAGAATIRATVIDNLVDSLWLDGINLKVFAVRINGQEDKQYKVHKRGISFHPEEPFKAGENLKIEIRYEARPRRGMYFVGWNDPAGKARKQIWTQGQGIDHRHWVPHVDDQRDKLRTSLEVIFDKGYEVVSNGELKEKEDLGATVRWKYELSKPHSSYLMMLAVGQYARSEEESGSGIPLYNYYYPHWKYRYEYTYYKNREIFDFMEQEVGVPFPWENYRQVPVVDFQHGAMENTAATIFGDFYFVDSLSFNDENYVMINAHELAHQWFGNWVTAEHSDHHWLHEGFATYYSWLVMKEIFGNEDFDKVRWQSYKNVAYAESLDDIPLQNGNAGSARFYDKGAWLLHMLKKEMGDALYKEAIMRYLDAYKKSIVTSADFIEVCESVSGKDLTPFFDQWLFQSGIPMIEVSVAKGEKGHSRALVFKQMRGLSGGQEPYRLTFPVVVHTNTGRYDITIDMDSLFTSVPLKLHSKELISAIEIDPDYTQLIDWSYNFNDEWKWQALTKTNSEILVARYIRSFELINYHLYKKLIEELPFAEWPDYVQAEWMKKAARNLDEADPLLVLSWMEDCSPLAASVFMKSMDVIPHSIKSGALQFLDRPSYEVKADALLKCSVSFQEEIPDFVERVKDFDGTRGNNVLVNRYVVELLARDNTHLLDWIDLTGPSYDFMTRMNALDGFALFGYYLNDRLTVNLFQALFQGNRRLSAKARDYLAQCYQKEEFQKTILAFVNDMKGDWEPWQKNKVARNPQY